MTSDLTRWVEDRIDADTQLDDEVGLLVLAAIEGDDELDGYLDAGATTPRPSRGDDPDDQPEASGTFLRSLKVSGFRGIGPAVQLKLDPVPGLTVVAGRNGSGKSSLAEALEVLLTGGTYRWEKKRSTQWRDHWRNLHQDGPVEVVAELVEEGRGLTSIRTTWEANVTDVNDRTTKVQRTVDGRKTPEQDDSVLGWARPLETFRPMLSYDELGGLLEAGPSELYDALAKVLGMEQLTDALERIKLRLKVLKEPGTDATTRRKMLLQEASGLDDERAAAVVPVLKKTAPDAATIRKLATGVTLPDHGVVNALRTVAYLEGPDRDAVSAATRRLREAVADMASAGEAQAERRVMRLELRKRAVHLHQQYGEQSCPVCDAATLDDSWLQTSRDLISHEEHELADLSTARTRLQEAREAARRLVTRRPAALDQSPTDDLDLTAARQAWDDFAAAPDGDLVLADHLDLHADKLADALSELRERAAVALAARDDAWGPLAGQIATWCDQWDAWLEAKPTVDRLAAADKWLKDNDTRLKNERLAPISNAARHAWSVLRQESNVELGELTLEGTSTSTRRRVAITAAVDGTEAGALAVMSQGELHALALALFLPRASMAESPFRFLILDDPIQAMDPAKIDGLVKLLLELAEHRQVIVFSHDDRLPAALRRSKSGARILEVTRSTDSRVQISSAEDPATRYLNDADALTRDESVPETTLRLTLPGLLRMAVESAARDRFFAERLKLGKALVDVEQAWDHAHTTSQRVSLAIHDDIKPLDNWIRTESRKVGLGAATTGMHEGLRTYVDPSNAVYHTRRLVNDIRTGSK